MHPFICGYSTTAVHEISNLRMRVRFPLPAHVETYSKLISFRKAFRARGRGFESHPLYNFVHHAAVAQLARALKINNQRFLFYAVSSSFGRAFVYQMKGTGFNSQQPLNRHTEEVGLEAAIF